MMHARKILIYILWLYWWTTPLFAEEKVSIGLLDLSPLGGRNFPEYGLLPKIVNASLKGSRFKAEYHFYPFLRLLTMMKNEEIQGGIVNSIQIDQAKFYSKTLMEIHMVFFYKKSRFPYGVSFDSLKELKDYKIGAILGAPIIGEFKKAGLEVQQTSNDMMNFKKLRSGRVDLVSSIDIIGFYFLRELGENIDDYGTTKPSNIIYSAIAVSKSIPCGKEIFHDLDRGYDLAKKNGTLMKILESFCGVGKVPDWLIP